MWFQRYFSQMDFNLTEDQRASSVAKKLFNKGSGSDVTSMMNTNLVAGRARMQTRHQMINAMYLPTLETQLEQENLCQGMAKLTEDHLEGVAAFKEKRAAKFTGR